VKLVLYDDLEGRFHWARLDEAGDLVAESRGFRTKAGARRSAEAVRGGIGAALIENPAT
jgi:uncharacterized protein YegP (UPF0339 family)